ncbi:MAG: hypothetical protein ACJAXG_001131 [Celeribacter sp.]|jgi:hypothetical protein
MNDKISHANKPNIFFVDCTKEIIFNDALLSASGLAFHLTPKPLTAQDQICEQTQGGGG